MSIRQKYVMFLLLSILLGLSAGNLVYAEEKTLLGDTKITHGGFGGPVVKISMIKDAGRVFVGGRGAWIINHKVSLGGGGYGLVSSVSGIVDNTNRYFHMGYGGFELGIIFRSDSLVHLNLITLIGGGGAVYSRRQHDEDYHDGWKSNGGDAFFVLEPMLYLELNVTKWFRTCLGAGYRYVDGLDSFPNFSDKDLSGASVELCFKFGKF
ncbi:MAG: hypothetical protein PHF84_06325 [bacterium]|nr:hypothetical protein [bacterium]